MPLHVKAIVGILLYPTLVHSNPLSVVRDTLPGSSWEAVPRQEHPQPAPKCQVQSGTRVPTLSPNLADPSAEDVANAIVAWLNDVCTVNSFLNNADDKTTALQTAITFANDEPTQLKTLSSVKGLSQAGQNAAAILEANFPSIPANLYNLQGGKILAYGATVAINFNRCCTVLPAIRVLVREASTATNAWDGSPPEPVFPNPCASIDCASGASKGASM